MPRDIVVNVLEAKDGEEALKISENYFLQNPFSGEILLKRVRDILK